MLKALELGGARRHPGRVPQWAGETIKMAEDAEPAIPAPRRDPYANFRFRLRWDGRYVAGVSRVSGLSRSAAVATHRAGGDPTLPRRMPGQSEYAAVTFERGLTHDPAFEQWANKVWDYHNRAKEEQHGWTGTAPVSLADFRSDIVVEVYNEAGQMVLAYTLYRCWPSEFVAMPELDSNGNAIAISMLKLENEGWEREVFVTEADSPRFTRPKG